MSTGPGHVLVRLHMKLYSALFDMLLSLCLQLSEKDMSMLEERIKRSAKKAPTAVAKQTATDRSQKEHPTNSNATFLRKPAQEDPNKLKYVSSDYEFVSTK